MLELVLMCQFYKLAKQPTYMIEEIRIQYRLLEERFVKIAWTHKIHEKQADLYDKKTGQNKTLLAFTTSFTTTSAVASLFSEFELDWILNIITALFAVISTYLTLRYKDNVLEEKSDSNRQYAAKCLSLRNAYESLLTDIMSERITDIATITEKRDKLEQVSIQLSECESKPSVTSKAVEMADRALKVNRETQTSDDEIKAIVPIHLQIL